MEQPIGVTARDEDDSGCDHDWRDSLLFVRVQVPSVYTLAAAR